jgi:Rrf2 family nitric oxide-sensitive transcriptional repressor
MPTMLRMSEATSLAFRTMRHLADSTHERRTARQIASALRVSEAHLHKVLQRLAHAGLVNSVRGPKGGFTLGRDPRTVTLREVYELLEGPLDLGPCLIGRSQCAEEEQCIFGGVIEMVNDLIGRRLGDTVLSDVASGNGGSRSDVSQMLSDRE